MSTNHHSTQFGYQKIPENEKASRVAAVFDSVVNKYDLMNDLMSLGVHRLWKKFTVEQAQIRPGHRVLDIAGGTGDLAEALAAKIGTTGEVVLADINTAMLNKGRDRLINAGIIDTVKFVQADVEKLPFQENMFDRVCIAFGLRNVTHIDQALQSMYQTLRPGGICLILEFSKPILPGLQSIYDLYSFKVLPRLGQWVAGDAASYQYLAESIRLFPPQDKLITMMENAGFEDCHYHNLSGGIVALHKGYKY